MYARDELMRNSLPGEGTPPLTVMPGHCESYWEEWPVACAAEEAEHELCSQLPIWLPHHAVAPVRELSRLSIALRTKILGLDDLASGNLPASAVQTLLLPCRSTILRRKPCMRPSELAYFHNRGYSPYSAAGKPEAQEGGVNQSGLQQYMNL